MSIISTYFCCSLFSILLFWKRCSCVWILLSWIAIIFTRRYGLNNCRRVEEEISEDAIRPDSSFVYNILQGERMMVTRQGIGHSHLFFVFFQLQVSSPPTIISLSLHLLQTITSSGHGKVLFFNAQHYMMLACDPEKYLISWPFSPLSWKQNRLFDRAKRWARIFILNYGQRNWNIRLDQT